MTASPSNIQSQIEEWLYALGQPQIQDACSTLPGCKQQVDRLLRCLTDISSAITAVPRFQVAFLGPSRHGKSTLLNALTGTSVLPMSDVRPCTASIVTLGWSQNWEVTIKFISKKRLLKELDLALQDAKEELERIEQNAEEDIPDDPRLFYSILQRFMLQHGIESDRPPREILDTLTRNPTAESISKYLGMTATMPGATLEAITRKVEDYLSTKEIYWSIVDSCEISGPFEDWHRKLTLVDLPGTNDRDPERTRITESMREKARAVALVKSDSNLGQDIESWLQNSSVLSQFLEATERSHQRIFILRTKFDSYHPEIDESLLTDDDDEEREAELEHEAIAKHMAEQSNSFHKMLRDIAAPLLPHARNEEEQEKLDELTNRLNQIPVFFVSAQAHEVFAGRFSTLRKNRRLLSERFNDDPEQTGVPGLRRYISELAEEFASDNYYADLQRRLEREVDQLVRFFRREGVAIEAELAGAGQSVRNAVVEIRESVVPDWKAEVRRKSREISAQSREWSNGIRNRLDQVWRMSERRLRDKQDKWDHIAWNSLKATARKGGSHTTCRGIHIDINQDICSILVDDVILAWTAYRDFMIQDGIELSTSELMSHLEGRLASTLERANVEEARRAVAELIRQVAGIAALQRLQVLQAIDRKIKELESIKAPAYAYVAKALNTTYRDITLICGTGSAVRMRNRLKQGIDQHIGDIRTHVYNLILAAMGELNDLCEDSLSGFGEQAAAEVEESLARMEDAYRHADETTIRDRLNVVEGVLAALPAP